MVLWMLLPITLSLVSFLGTWTVYGLALANKHVCSLSDWVSHNYCKGNQTTGCCLPPTISSSGTSLPENSLFSASVNAGAFLFFLFCIFHHAHIMEKHSHQSLLSKFTLVCGVTAAMGAFTAGNCNPGYLALIHYLGAAISFTCICFYTSLVTILTGRCVLTGYERFLLPLRITSCIFQIFITICYTVLFAQDEYYYVHLSAIFEWMLSVNLELFELTFAVEFYFFSSFMLSNLLSERDEQKPLMMTMS